MLGSAGKVSVIYSDSGYSRAGSGKNVFESVTSAATTRGQRSPRQPLPMMTASTLPLPPRVKPGLLLLKHRNARVISVTGHRDLLPEDSGYLRGEYGVLETQVQERLHQITRATKQPHAILSALAAGADQLVAWVGLQMNLPLLVVLPMPLEHYESDFAGDAAAYEAFRQLLSRAVAYTELPGQRPDGQDRDWQYEQTGHYLIANSQVMFALWDGVDNALPGGTSEVVRLALDHSRPAGFFPVGKGAQKPLIAVHQLITPRQKNIFPLGRTAQVPVLAALLPGTDYTWRLLHGGGRARRRNYRSMRWNHISRSAILYQFFFPLALFVSTTALGYWGYSQAQNPKAPPPAAKASAPAPAEAAEAMWDNILFKAINLNKLDSDGFDPKCFKGGTVPGVLRLARVTGAVLVIWAFALAAGVAFKPTFLRLGLFLRKGRYSIVCGLGTKGVELVQNLRESGHLVAVVDPMPDNPLRAYAQSIGARYFFGDAASPALLRKLYFGDVRDVFLFHDSDEANIRVVQQLDQFVGPDAAASQWYVHVEDQRHRFLLHQTVQQQQRIHVLNIYENIARRLLFQYPLDRFYHAPNAHTMQIIVLGFGPVAREIVLACLRLGHFARHVSLRITVYSDAPERHDSEFAAAYPCTYRRHSVFGHNPAAAAVQEYVFFYGEAQSQVVSFEPLPVSDTHLLEPGFSLYHVIRPEYIVNVYACLDDGLQSAAYLSTILPKIEALRQEKRCDLQAFCFYNLSDLNQAGFVERRLNRLAPTVPVFFFGNFAQECSVAALKDRSLDALPRQLALWHYLHFDFQATKDRNRPDLNRFISRYLTEKGLPVPAKTANGRQDWSPTWLSVSTEKLTEWSNHCWSHLPENERESNRQAADHLWVKIRQANCRLTEQYTAPEAFSRFLAANPALATKLAEMEHRRWCAEKLLDGWLPDEAVPGNDPADEPGREKRKKQKLHPDLKAFAHINTGYKDSQQIISIPYVLRTYDRGVVTPPTYREETMLTK